MADRFVIPTPRCGPFVLGPDSQRQPGVPRGTVTKAEWCNSSIFPGTRRDYYVYVPVQYTPHSPANVMVFQDGGSYANAEGDTRVPIVFDNLIHQGRMPVTITVSTTAMGRTTASTAARSCLSRWSGCGADQ